MSKNCSIMQRMKENYESRSKTFLTRRTPVIMRLDGKAFHTYTKGLDKPFDEGLIEDMQETAKYLCENIQGAKLAYTQSDEISILIIDYDKLTSQGWFNYNIQKMVSVSASMATAKFNQLRQIRNFLNKNNFFREMLQEDFNIITKKGGFIHKGKVIQKFQQEVAGLLPAFFDSRVFNIPKEEVSNYFLARQKDAVKNSISMLAQSLYSHKELHKKNGNEMQELCFQKGHNWNDLHFSKKRGSTIQKVIYLNGKKLPIDLQKMSLEDKLSYIKEDVTFEKGFDGIVIKDSTEITTRNKWELVETPMNFNDEYFKQII